MEHRKEAGNGDCDTAAALDKSVGKLPIFLTQALTQLAVTNLWTEKPPQEESNSFTEK
jgi:hypothetical protein